MSGEVDLSRLIAEARPVLGSETYVFVTLQSGTAPDHPAVVATIREAEGLTLIAERGWAESQGLSGTFPCCRITLTIHSALDAVGLMAAVSAALAAGGVSANPVSGFYHDHLFVPVADAERALDILEAMTREAQSRKNSPPSSAS